MSKYICKSCKKEFAGPHILCPDCAVFNECEKSDLEKIQNELNVMRAQNDYMKDTLKKIDRLADDQWLIDIIAKVIFKLRDWE